MDAVSAQDLAARSQLMTSRVTITAGLFGCVLALVGGLWAFAPAAHAGSSPPLTGALKVPGPLVGGGQREGLPFQFTSEKFCNDSCQSEGGATGFARIDMPPPQVDPLPAPQKFLLGYGDGPGPLPQVDDSKVSGYVSVDKGSCRSLSIDSIAGATFADPDAPAFIELKYRCERGERFTVTYSPRVDWFGFNEPGSVTDEWEFGLSHRDRSGEPWEPMDGSPAIEVLPVIIQPPNLFYTAPPGELVETEVAVPPGEDPILYLTFDGRDEDAIKIESTTTTQTTNTDPTKFILIDASDQGIPLDLNPPGADSIRVARQEIRVFGCGDVIAAVSVLCPSPFDNVLRIDQGTVTCSQNPQSIYAALFYFDPTQQQPCKSAKPKGGEDEVYNARVWAAIDSVSVSHAGWSFASRDCGAAGGSFNDTDASTPTGDGPVDWRCDFAATQGMTREELRSFKRRARDPRVCASTVVSVERNWAGGGGDDDVWCKRATL